MSCGSAYPFCWRVPFWGLAVLFLPGPARLAAGADDSDVPAELRKLQEQNQLLRNQLNEQQKLIEGLTRKVSALEQTSQTPAPAPPPATEERPERPAWLNGLGQVKLTGEGAVGFFHSGSQGKFPNGDFRVDEARLFLEAPLWQDTYFASQIDIVSRDEPMDEGYLRLGELYLDFENVSRIWNASEQLALRAGRVYIPFGEEYQVRDANKNPLISRSLSDLWGIDEGVELYGKLGPARYVVAVQNGGHPMWQDFTSDKSVAGRVSYDPLSWLHLSVSAMRTGDLSVEGDGVSELWFGSGFIRALGSPTNTSTFHAELVEGDVQFLLPRGHLKAAGGWMTSGDDSPGNTTDRDVYYYYVEALGKVTRKSYAAVRFSQILAEDGFPIVGNGSFGQYFFGELTTQLWRLSLGLGHHLSPNLILKGEYTFEEGRTVTGNKRFHEDLFALQAAFQF